MLRRYTGGIVSGSAPISTSGANFVRDLIINRTRTQETHNTFFSGGAAGAVLTIQLTSFSGFTGGAGTLYCDAFGGLMNVGQQFTITLDAAGNADFHVIIDLVNTTGAPLTATAVMTIISISTGTIGNPSTQTYSHLTPP